MEISVNRSEIEKSDTDKSKTKSLVQKAKSQPVNKEENIAPQKQQIPTKPEKSDLKNSKVSPDKNKKKKKFPIWILIFLLIVGGLGGYIYYRGKSFTEKIGIKLTPKDILNPVIKDPELKKDSTGKFTNVLLVGIDTRVTDSGLKNTDSMIVASYNYDTQNIVMISVPRDIYVKIPGKQTYGKINSVYAYGEKDQKGNGLSVLQDEIEKVTGLEIQYYAMVDLAGFKRIIDTIGGVEVNVDRAFTGTYPTENPKKPEIVVSFKQGLQKMDGDTALKYARIRHSSDPIEGSDFARARRQQKIIMAVKDKALKSETLLNPIKISEIMAAVQDNLKISEITNEDMQAGILLLKKYDKGNSYSFVLDPAIGNFKVLTDDGVVPNLYAIAPVKGLENYTDVKAITQQILQNPALYSEKATVVIYDAGIGNVKAKDIAAKFNKEYPFLNVRYAGTLYKDKVGTVVFDQTDNQNPVTLKFMSDYFKSTSNAKPDYVKTKLNGEKITVLLGKDESSADTSGNESSSATVSPTTKPTTTVKTTSTPTSTQTSN